MPKPFSLLFPYAPNYQDNRERPKDEQFIVRFRDLSVEERISFAEKLDEAFPITDDTKENERYKLTLKRMQWLRDFAVPRIRRVENLTLSDTDDNGAEVDVQVRTGDQLVKYLPDVVTEVGTRIIFGASQEEIKNSPSQSSAASSQTT